MTQEITAAKLAVSIEKLKEWEDGKTQPIIRKAQILAKVYKTPFALFFFLTWLGRL